MKNKFQNQYNRDSTRLKSWDYSSDAIYFITISSKDKINFFGEIADDVMILSDEGKLIENVWKLIPETFDFADLGEFVVMPNHFHALISITKKQRFNKVSLKSNNTKSIEYQKDRGGFAGEKNPMLNDNISKVIRWFKGKCAYEIRKFNKNFAWQSRFHDHIIRDSVSFQRIENYIIENPKRWNDDSLR